MTPEEASQIRLCRALMAHKSKSFRLASLLLPPSTRSATFALYAWCRRCDDALDERDLRGGESADQAVARLTRELDAVYAGTPQSDPILAAFQRVVHEHRIPALYPRELLLGMEMDARGTHYATRADLLRYCYRVAGTVGLMMCHVMGVKDPAALRNAAHLGIAMQLTNVCRDVLEDLTLDRLYLPAELLFEPGSEAPHTFPRSAGGLAQMRPAIIRATRTLLADADHYYRSADRGIAALGFRCALAVRTARLLYAAIGRRLAQQDFDPLCGRAVTPASWKAALVLKSLLLTLRELPQRVLSRAQLTIPSHAVEPHDVVPL